MTRPPTVIILDPDHEVRAEMQRALTVANLTVLTQAGHGTEGHTLVSDLHPDCVLLGLEAPVERGLKTLGAIVHSDPDIPVIVYSSIAEGAAVRRAMLTGARDYLAFPVSDRTLRETIHEVLDRTVGPSDESAAKGEPDSAVAGMVITVFGVKGGIGKSTISSNLAVALARDTGASVAIVDMDPRFGDVAIMLDALVERSLADAARDFEQLDRTTIRKYLTLHPAGVSILPAPVKQAEWADVTPEQVERVVNLLAKTFDYVVLDTPGVFDELVAAALDLATVALVVTSLDMASIKDTAEVLSVLRTWEFPEEKVHLIVNHSNQTNSVNEVDIARTLDYNVYWSIPFDDAVVRSTQAGQPLVLWRPNSRAAVNLRYLAALVSGSRLPESQRAHGGFLRRLLTRRRSRLS